MRTIVTAAALAVFAVACAEELPEFEPVAVVLPEDSVKICECNVVDVNRWTVVCYDAFCEDCGSWCPVGDSDITAGLSIGSEDPEYWSCGVTQSGIRVMESWSECRREELDQH